MSHSPDESNPTPKAMPIRIRTVMVPLFGAALYYAVILAVNTVAVSVLGVDFDRYRFTVHAVTILVLLPAVLLWLRFSEKFEDKRVYRESVSPGKILAGITIALGLLGITLLYFYLVEEVLSSFSFVQESVEEYKKWVQADPLSLLEKIMYAVTLTVLVPIAEELIFRGIILQEFLSTMKPVVAVILASVFFGIIHMQPIQVIYAFFCGAVISAVYVLSRSIFLSILLHGIYNFFGSVVPTMLPANGSWANTLGFVYLGSIVLSVVAVVYLRRSQIRKSIDGG